MGTELNTNVPAGMRLTVAIIGNRNAGKSTLLNRIVGQEVSIVSDEPGTTTDAVAKAYELIPVGPVSFYDTAGLDDEGELGRQRVQAAKKILRRADMVLLVIGRDGLTKENETQLSKLAEKRIPFIPVFNFCDERQLGKFDRAVMQLYDGVAVSAKTGEGIDNLLEMVNLTAEMQELKANPNRSAHGAVIEARLDKGRGPVATLLVQNGTLHQGDVIIAGTAVGRVRAMTSAKGEKLTEAGPSVPVEIIGMGEVPGAGDDFHAVADERMARELVEQRKHEQKMAASAPVGKVSLEDLFSQIKQGEMKDLNIIVKADVQGSAEAVKASLEKLSNEEVRVRVIHCAVGAISESDVMLATTSNAIIVGFNVRPDNNAKESAARNNVDMRMYRVIYDCINEIETAMKGMLAPKFKEVELGQAEVRNVFRITGVGMVAGCYVTGGKMQRGAQMRLLRDNIVIYDGAIASLQRFKDSVKEVAQGYECGITFEKFQDIKEGDIIEAFIMEEIER